MLTDEKKLKFLSTLERETVLTSEEKEELATLVAKKIVDALREEEERKKSSEPKKNYPELFQQAKRKRDKAVDDLSEAEKAWIALYDEYRQDPDAKGNVGIDLIPPWKTPPWRVP